MTPNWHAQGSGVDPDGTQLAPLLVDVVGVSPASRHRSHGHLLRGGGRHKGGGAPDAAPYTVRSVLVPTASLAIRTRGGSAWWAAQYHPKFPRVPAALLYGFLET